MKKVLNIFIGIAAIVYLAALICYSKAVTESVVKAIKTCLTTIIPSLYAFMVVSGFVVSSNLYKALSKPFDIVSRYIFRIPTEYFSVFILSSAAGYPIGAKLITDLYRQNKIDVSTAEKMLGYCYLGGPAFFCGVAGSAIYSSIKAGLLIFLCIFISNFILGAALGLKNKVPQKEKEAKISFDMSVHTFIDSIYSGGAGILKICGAIIFFASITAVLEETGAIAFAANRLSRLAGVSYSDCICIIRSILEISNISGISHDVELMPIVTSLLSFGGLCVIMQVEGIIQNNLSTNIYYLCRIMSIFISYICCKIIIYVFRIDETLQISSSFTVGYRHISPIPSLFLLIMTILLLSNNYIAKNKKM